LSQKISEMLEEEFGFTGTIGGSEYESFSPLKQFVCDQLLAEGIAYRMIKSNLETACMRTKKYASHVEKYISGDLETIPLWSKPGDVEGLLVGFQLLKAEIERLIRCYDFAS